MTGKNEIQRYIEALKDKDWYVRWRSASALGDIGPDARAAVPALIKALKGKDWYVDPKPWRVDSMALRDIPEEATSVFIEASDKGWRVKSFKPKGRGMHEAAAIALRKIGESAIPALIKALKDNKIKWKVADVLGDIGPGARSAVPALIRALRDKDWGVRRKVAWALGKIGLDASAAMPALAKALKDEEWEVREGAAWALGKIGPNADAAMPALIEALTDENCNVREKAALALNEMGVDASAGVPAPTKVLKDKYKRMREWAAYCIKCRAKKEMKDAKVITMKNGEPATQGICSTCGTKMFRIGRS